MCVDAMPMPDLTRLMRTVVLERLKKYCSHSERGFLGFGEASAKEQVQENPVTEPKRRQNPKRPLRHSWLPNGYSIFENALTLKP
jgi:hypothetical protein